MKILNLCALIVFVSFSAHAQLRVGIFGGTANYQGDLADYLFTPLRPSGGFTVAYQMTGRFTLRGGVTWARITAADRYGQSDFQIKTRNLSFETNLSEISFVGELDILRRYFGRFSPYVMGGVAYYQYNPYTYDLGGQKVYLRPLSTEGQGLPQYPDRKPYSLQQFAIPFGGGLRYNLSPYVQISGELGIRKLFTDYFDDISQGYIDPAILLQERGPQAVALSYRGGEVLGETVNYPDDGYPIKDAVRGRPAGKDWYYFSALHLTMGFDLFSGNGSGGGRIFNRRRFGCPGNPM